MISVVLLAERYSVWVARKDANIMDDIRKLMDENKELKMAISRYTDECERLTGELKECELEIKAKDLAIERYMGMVEAFEICVKARK